MSDGLVFYAQNLDNNRPDHVQVDDNLLSPNDKEGREATVAQMSRVAKAAACVYDDGSVRRRDHGGHFVLEVPCVERDEAGRIARIACYGQHKAIDNNKGALVAAGVAGFARRISRTIAEEHLAAVSRAMGAEKVSVWARLVRWMETVIGSIGEHHESEDLRRCPGELAGRKGRPRKRLLLVMGPLVVMTVLALVGLLYAVILHHGHSCR